MPPKFATKENSASTSKRRNRRLAYKIKSLAKRQSTSSKEQPSPTKESRKLPCRKSVAKRQHVSLNEQPSSSKEQSSSSKEQPSSSKEQPSTSVEQPSSSIKQPSTKESRKLPHRRSVAKRQPASSNEGQSTSTEKSTVKKRRVMKMKKLDKNESQIGIKKKQDFSVYIHYILGELSPELKISEAAIASMNTSLSYVFERLAASASVFLSETSSDVMSVHHIETAVNRVIGGKLAKYCIAEGRIAYIKSLEE